MGGVLAQGIALHLKAACASASNKQSLSSCGLSWFRVFRVQGLGLVFLEGSPLTIGFISPCYPSITLVKGEPWRVLPGASCGAHDDPMSAQRHSPNLIRALLNVQGFRG